MNRFKNRFAKLVATATVFAFSSIAYAADLTGTWSFEVQTAVGAGMATFHLEQDGDKLTGRYTGPLGEAELTGSVDGDSFEWEYTLEGMADVSYTGVLLEDGSVKGDADYGDFLGEATFTGTKQ